MQTRKEYGLYPTLRQLDHAISDIEALRTFIDDPSTLKFVEKQGPPIKNGYAIETTIGGLTVKLTLTGLDQEVRRIDLVELSKDMQEAIQRAAKGRELELTESLPETFAQLIHEVEDQCQRYPSIAQFRAASILLSEYHTWIGVDRVYEAVERCQAAWDRALKDQTHCRVPRVFPSQTTLFLRHRTPHTYQRA